MHSISFRARAVSSSRVASSRSPVSSSSAAVVSVVAKANDAVLVVRRRRRSATVASMSSSNAASLAHRNTSQAAPLASPRSFGSSLDKKNKCGSFPKQQKQGSIVAGATSTPSPQPWPAATANVFAPGPQHYAAVAVSSLKWLGATVAILIAADVSKFQSFALAGAAATADAGWVPWAVRALGTNVIMAVGCASALQSLLETGLTPKVAAGPALVLGMLGSAVFRAVHLFGYREVYSSTFFEAGVGVAGAAGVVLVLLLAHLASENKKRKAASPTLSSLVPARSGLPAAYALVAVAYVAIGIALQVVPGDALAPYFAAVANKSTLPSVASTLGEALRAAIGSTLVFPASVGAWVLKDAAENGQLSWPSSRALNWGLLLSSAARVGIIAGAAASGDILSSQAVWQLPCAVHAAVALVALAGLNAK